MSVTGKISRAVATYCSAWYAPPPSTWICAPVRNFACSLHTNATMAAEVVGVADAVRGGDVAPVELGDASGAVEPGCTELTVTRCRRPPGHRLQERWRRPAAVLDRISSAIGWRTDSDVIDPSPAAVRIGWTAAFTMPTTDIRLRSRAAG